MIPSRSVLVVAFCGLSGLALFAYAPLLACADRCFVDLAALHGPHVGAFELTDTRLNTWILAWVQRALISQPFHLFEANTFYPAANALAGSEHLIGLAVLTLPLRLVTSNAVLIYQLTLMLTSVILMLTTFGLVRWLTGSVWASFLAAAIALLMPWRITELSHIQLMAACWFPLIWWLVLRVSSGRGRRRDVVLLSLVLSLQLLSSYYLAYAISLTLVILVPCAGGLRRTSRLAQLGLAFVMPYLLLLLTSLPYLSRSTQGTLTSGFTRTETLMH